MGDLSVSVRYTQIYRNDTNGSFSTPGVVSAEYYFPSYLKHLPKTPQLTLQILRYLLRQYIRIR